MVAGPVNKRGEKANFNRQNVNQEQPLLLEELLEQEKREQERDGGAEWVGGVGVSAAVGVAVSATVGANVPTPAPPAVPLYTGVPPTAPPPPPDRIVTDADRHAQLLYEQWLQQYNAFATDQLRYYDAEVQKLRKIRKSLNSKQRQLRKSGNELTPTDAAELRRVSTEQAALQKHLEAARKQARQHSMLLQCCARGRPIIVEWERDARHSAGLSLVRALRSECLKKRRISQRSYRRPNSAELVSEYKKARRYLNKAIKDSKRRCGKELVEEVEKDPRGRSYKVVMAHLKSQLMPSPTSPKFLQKIVTALFLQHRKFDYPTAQDESEDIPTVTEKELKDACNRVGNNNAPGLDGIPNIALKTVIKAAPALFTETYDTCLKKGYFPSRWKQKILVLLLKGKKTTRGTIILPSTLHARYGG
ncbi:Putative 115 kDa protein in type-1 retrotransposable element R1DM [Eumeta japonica]|uniref:115 kDa protein in type-1 retrotransposable element R1DM n=1 Tax=Eumeta variegata TaxID=151549 RepID=A0A4C1WTU0_EUMVA|nr:Putative 115 kDa protein in type-1 retrotransposable element R1DM [Eumeta japonica]